MALIGATLYGVICGSAGAAGGCFAILPKNVRARVSIEAGSTIQWARYVGIDGASVGVDTFGKSAPLKIVQEEVGLTVDKVLATAHKVLRASGASNTAAGG